MIIKPPPVRAYEDISFCRHVVSVLPAPRVLHTPLLKREKDVVVVEHLELPHVVHPVWQPLEHQFGDVWPALRFREPERETCEQPAATRTSWSGIGHCPGLKSRVQRAILAGGPNSMVHVGRSDVLGGPLRRLGIFLARHLDREIGGDLRIESCGRLCAGDAQGKLHRVLSLADSLVVGKRHMRAVQHILQQHVRRVRHISRHVDPHKVIPFQCVADDNGGRVCTRVVSCPHPDQALLLFHPPALPTTLGQHSSSPLLILEDVLRQLRNLLTRSILATERPSVVGALNASALIDTTLRKGRQPVGALVGHHRPGLPDVVPPQHERLPEELQSVRHGLVRHRGEGERVPLLRPGELLGLLPCLCLSCRHCRYRAAGLLCGKVHRRPRRPHHASPGPQTPWARAKRRGSRLMT
mmetsp:Transcript_6363/g.18625  ORF Transcript_6363/g.18625 Transcript_6363/m.18625 type:complete len:411 (-) Transcript_6363:115-1347(-)